MLTRYLAKFIDFFTVLVEVFLGLRVILKLFGANPDVAFVQAIYESSGVLMEPFRGIFPSGAIAPGHILDFSVLFAMLIYGLIGALLVALVTWLVPPPTTRKSKK